MNKYIILILSFCFSFNIVNAFVVDIPVQVENSELKPEFTYELSMAELQREYPVGICNFGNIPKNRNYKFQLRTVVEDCDIYRQDGDWSTGEDNTKGYLAIPLNVCLPGQEFKGVLKSLDDDELITFFITPNPLIATSSKDGATLSAHISSVFSNVYYLKLRGFGKDEDVTFLSTSGSEKINQKIKSCGERTISFLPATIGSEGGVATVSVKRKNGEVLSLELIWGNEFGEYFNLRK